MYNFAALIGGILIFQYFVLFSFDEYVPGYIPILQLERSELIEHGFSTIDKAFRARSVLGEPSEIGIVIGLALFLKTDSMIKKNSILVQDYLLFFYFCFCLLLSRSGTGAGVLIFCLFYLGFWKNFIFIHYVFMRIILIILLVQPDFLFNVLELGIDRAATRTTGFDELYSQSGYQIFFGNGTVGREGMLEWGGGIARIIKFYGIIGLILFIAPLILLSTDLRHVFHMMYLFVFSVLTQLPISVWVVFVFPFIFANLNQTVPKRIMEQ